MMVTLHFLAAIQIHGEIKRCSLLISCTMRHPTIKETFFLLLAARHILVFVVMHLMTCPCILHCHDLSKKAEMEPFRGTRLFQWSTSSLTATTGWMPDPADKTNPMQIRRSWTQLLPFLLS